MCLKPPEPHTPAFFLFLHKLVSRLFCSLISLVPDLIIVTDGTVKCNKQPLYLEVKHVANPNVITRLQHLSKHIACVAREMDLPCSFFPL